MVVNMKRDRLENIRIIRNTYVLRNVLFLVTSSYKFPKEINEKRV